MGYRCGVCGESISPGLRASRTIIEYREKDYLRRERVNKCVDRDGSRTGVEGKIYYTDDPGGKGVEPVREILACPECAIE